MRGEPNIQGLLYWAVGEGKPSWDTLLPNPTPKDTQLTQEVKRYELFPEQISYLADHSNHTSEPSNRLEISLNIDGSTLVDSGFQSLREFGLFGGNATPDPNSGFMINRAIHPRIDITPEMTLSRTLQLTFKLTEYDSFATTVFTGQRSAFPVSFIDGVDSEYEKDLTKYGISTLAETSSARSQTNYRQYSGR